MKKGSALLLIIIISALLMSLAGIVVKMVYNEYASEVWRTRREQACWLAEAGLEQAKINLRETPGWYTDLPHVPADDSDWVKKKAVGEAGQLGPGRFKIVREQGKDQVYAAGFCGPAVVVLRLKNWKEI